MEAQEGAMRGREEIGGDGEEKGRGGGRLERRKRKIE
jgi:hypothetical protein